MLGFLVVLCAVVVSELEFRLCWHQAIFCSRLHILRYNAAERLEITIRVNVAIKTFIVKLNSRVVSQ